MVVKEHTITSAPVSTESGREAAEIRFASALPGFPGAHRFSLVEPAVDAGPFRLLRSLDDAQLQFLVVPPNLFFADYVPEIDDDTAGRLDLHEPDDALLLVIVSIGDRVADATANLLAPIVVNRHSRDAAQVVLTDSDFELRAPLAG